MPNNNKTSDVSVSVVIPVYNSRKYLSVCLESVTKQSYRPLEIILINDGSTDGSGELCDAYAGQDKRIKVIHVANRGPAAARNAGLERATGEYLMFLDSDDCLTNGAIELLVERNREQNADLVVGDFNKLGRTVSASGHQAYFSGTTLLNKRAIIDYVRSYLQRPNRFPLFVYSWGRLFKRSIIKEHQLTFDAGLFTFEDVAFNFRYLKFTKTLLFVPEVVYSHLLNDNYVSAGMTVGRDPRKLFGYRQALVSVRDFLQGAAYGAGFKKEFGQAYVSYTIIQLIRACGQIGPGNRQPIAQTVKEIIASAELRANLPYYSPGRGESRFLPLLMKYQLVWPLIWACQYKAFKRYKKGQTVK
jgi:glycosyltransferase involved in cell wall biosynthesis